MGLGERHGHPAGASGLPGSAGENRGGLSDLLGSHGGYPGDNGVLGGVPPPPPPPVPQPLATTSGGSGLLGDLLTMPSGPLARYQQLLRHIRSRRDLIILPMEIQLYSKNPHPGLPKVVAGNQDEIAVPTDESDIVSP